jgi:glycosyltransferase involved in cell wall biosynthesis
MPVATTNLEGLSDYDVEWRWSDGGLEPGFTAVLRVKNEARSLPFVLPALLRSVVRVLVIDNGSTDGTPEVARDVAAAEGMAAQLEVVTYPFTVARYGTEHLNTHPASIRSPTYFYNWAFSQARTTYSLKWDGDMVLSREGERVLRDLAWQVEGQPTVVRIPRFGLYVESSDVAWVDVALTNREYYGWPNAEGVLHDKGFEWEIPLFGDKAAKKILLPDGICFEIKWLDTDEFTHWSHRDFGETPRTARKLRELEVFERLMNNETLPGLVRVERGNRSHVIEEFGELSVLEWNELTESAVA